MDRVNLIQCVGILLHEVGLKLTRKKLCLEKKRRIIIVIKYEKH